MSDLSSSLSRVLGCAAILVLVAACNHAADRSQPTTVAVQTPAAKPAQPPVIPIEPAPKPALEAEPGMVESGGAKAALAGDLQPEPPLLLAPPRTDSDTIRVALLLPLTGSAADVGRALFAAAQMALFDFNNPRLALLPRDTAGTPQGAAEAAQRALSEGAEIILGPVFAESVAAVAPLAKDHGVNVVAFSNDRTVAGDGVYLLGLLPEAQVDRVVDFARLQGVRRVATLTPDSAYGRRIVESLKRASLRYGIEVGQIERYPADAEPGDEAMT